MQHNINLRVFDYALAQRLKLPMSDANKIMKRLCKHFSHKVHVSIGENDASIRFDEGFCNILAGEKDITFICASNDTADLKDITDTIDRHVASFCRDESFTFSWSSLS
ncbi:MAG: DUF2218 domain-containing protein [Acidiferrobacterales bacterium]|nr:DUF2218 domain-containing protein [Acidiferrobacterales bacterium]